MKTTDPAKLGAARVQPPKVQRPGECEIGVGDHLLLRVQHQADDVWEVLLVGSGTLILLGFDTDRQMAIGKAQAVLDVGETKLHRHLVTGDVE